MTLHLVSLGIGITRDHFATNGIESQTLQTCLELQRPEQNGNLYKKENTKWRTLKCNLFFSGEVFLSE